MVFYDTFSKLVFNLVLWVSCGWQLLYIVPCTAIATLNFAFFCVVTLSFVLEMDKTDMDREFWFSFQRRIPVKHSVVFLARFHFHLESLFYMFLYVFICFYMFFIIYFIVPNCVAFSLYWRICSTIWEWIFVLIFLITIIVYFSFFFGDEQLDTDGLVFWYPMFLVIFESFLCYLFI